MRMTKESARSFLRGKYVPVNDGKEFLQAVTIFDLIGRNAMNLELSYPFALSFFSDTSFDTFAIKDCIEDGDSKLSLQDLLQIEIIDENPLKMNPETIREFVKEVQNEFSDMSLEYLTYKADQFIERNPDKFETDCRAKYESAIGLLKLNQEALRLSGNIIGVYGNGSDEELNAWREYHAFWKAHTNGFIHETEQFLIQHNQENP